MMERLSRGYQIVVWGKNQKPETRQRGGGTSNGIFNEVTGRKRESKRVFARELLREGIGARGEIYAGHLFGTLFMQARVVADDNGKPKIVYEEL